MHPYTLASRSKPSHMPKLTKEYGCPTARTKRKHGHTTKPIRNAGFGGILKVKSFNKHIGKRTVKCLEIPHYA